SPSQSTRPAKSPTVATPQRDSSGTGSVPTTADTAAKAAATIASPPIHMSGLSAEPSLNRTAAAINTAEPPATSAWGARNPRGRVETSSLFARRPRAVCIASQATDITFGSGTPNKQLTPFGQTSDILRLSVAALTATLAAASPPLIQRLRTRFPRTRAAPQTDR